MLRKEVHVTRPERWDMPFDDQSTRATQRRIMEAPPFSAMDDANFPDNCSLSGIVQNDARIRAFRPGDIVVREGEYGSSAFLILTGAVRVALDALPDEMLGRPQHAKEPWWSLLRRMLVRSPVPEYRKSFKSESTKLRQRNAGGLTQVFLQDLPGILDEHRTMEIGAGEFFGEVAALSRTPRSATVFATTETELLEIRWQGLRDLMRYDSALQSHIHNLYRQNSLLAHLRQTPWLAQLGDAELAELADATEFQTFGEFEWHRPYRELLDANPNERIEAEPLIAGEGEPADALLLIRNGFARLSQQRGVGHQTCSYLGKGQVFGLEELYGTWKSGNSLPLTKSLRAVGYVDILRIPRPNVERLILPHLDDQQIQTLNNSLVATHRSSPGAASPRSPSLPPSLLEFVVDQRLMNGTEAMVINLDRCTRCDDCVRACADTHDNNPRFVRQGQVHGSLMIASACMHCVDPVCMIGCPTGAINRNPQSGTVSIHDGSCIGCQTCANSCPYEAIRMVEIRNGRNQFYIDQSTHLPISKATKCDLCEGLFGGPACARACPHDALERIDLTDPNALEAWISR